MSSFAIIENSFGGAFPSTIELETPPNITVRIVEDSLLQNLIKILGCGSLFKDLYSNGTNNIKKSLLKEFTVNNEVNVIKFYFITMFSYLASFFVNCWIFPKTLKRLISKSSFDIYGYISPIKKNYIYLSSKKINKDNCDVNKTISHENIHILQTHIGDLDMDKRLMDKERVNQYCELYLNAKVEHQSIIKYLLSKVEIEARVHELVSAFYVETNNFPLTRKEFIVCLLYSNDILEDLSIHIQRYHSNHKNTVDLLDEINEQAAAMSIHSPVSISTHATVDFICILNTISSSDELFNFISFELPTYYCNVLKLYGSKSASSKLQSEINEDRQLYCFNLKNKATF